MNDSVNFRWSLLATMLAFLLAGCASGPQLGVRPAFEQREVPKIAVVPFYSLSSFSMPADQVDEALAVTEAAAVDTLRQRGFEVMESSALQQYLAEHGADTIFDDGVLLRSELIHYFEPAEHVGSQPALEVATLQKLYQQGKLPAEVLLFGELVYHTETQCRLDPTDYNDNADVAHDAGESADKTCVVSHFQAKLVYAPTGETMWFNQKLLQTYTGQPSSEKVRANLAQTVARTLGGEHGLATLRQPEKSAALDKK